MVEKIKPAAARRLLAAGQARVVDVREPEEYAEGHIPGAVLLPLGRVEAEAPYVLPNKEAVWLIYCRSGVRSARAAAILAGMGYRHLYDLGGILRWPYEVE